MPRQYVPVPYDAIDLAFRPQERLLVLHLYQEGHDRRWRPITRSVLQLGRDHGLSEGSARRLLKRLEQAGLLRMESLRTGGRSEGSVIRVFDPQTVADGAADGAADGRRTATQQVRQHSPRRGGQLADGAADGAADLLSSDPDPDHDLVEQVRVHDPAGKEPAAADRQDPSPRKGAKVGKPHERFEEVLGIWNERVVPATGIGAHPRLSHRTGLGRTLDLRLRQHGRDAIVHLMQWYATGADPRADYLRRERYGLDTLLRPSKLDGYLALVRAWVARGCPRAGQSGRGAHPGDLEGDRAYLATWRPDPLPPVPEAS